MRRAAENALNVAGDVGVVAIEKVAEEVYEELDYRRREVLGQPLRVVLEGHGQIVERASSGCG